MISGKLTWHSRQIQVSKGRNTLSWIYRKDAGHSCGKDLAWIANIHMVAGKCFIKDCLKKGWDYWPIHYSKLSNVANAKACQVLCQKNNKCQVFTYLKSKDSL